MSLQNRNFNKIILILTHRMSITINFTQEEVSFDFNGKALTKPLGTPLKTPYMLSRSVIFVHNDDKMFRIDWKLWNNIEQFVEVNTYDGKNWVLTTQWSYIALPQPGTSQTSEIKCSGVRGFNLRIIGAPHGDWSSGFASNL